MRTRSSIQRRMSFDDVGIVAKAVIVVAPVVAAALFYVWAEVTTVRMGYMLSEAGEVHRQLLEQNRGLRIEVAALRAPDRLEKLAAERYQLEPPRTEQVIRFEGASIAGSGAIAKVAMGEGAE